MKSAKKLVLAAVVLPLTLGTASAFAFGGKDHHKGPRDECGMGMDRGIMRDLNLTDAQKDQLQSFRDANRAEMKANIHKTAKHAWQSAKRITRKCSLYC